MIRRHVLAGATACILLVACRSVPALAAEPVTPEQARYLESRERMLKKFGRPGYELVVDAMKGQKFIAVDFFYEYAKQFYGAGRQRLQTRAKMMQSQPAPERARILWRDPSASGEGNMPGIGGYQTGNIIGDEIIEVGSRIPQELIDDLKRDPKGNLRLKFRMSDQGTLFGWDIERRPGFDPKKRDQFGEAVYVAPEHSFAGGDFREARIINGKPVRMGWYIDRHTGQKIETDF
jgi:hypothetical protein